MKSTSFNTAFNCKVIALFALVGALALAVPVNHRSVGLLAPLYARFSGLYSNSASLPTHLLDLSER